MRWPLLLILCLLSWEADAATVFLCKAYSGGTFWSSAHCSMHKATIDRMVTVPDGLPFDQQVNLAEQNRANTAALYAAPAQQRTVIVHQQGQQQGKSAECKALSAEIASLDSAARQAQSGQSQDWLNERRRKARDRQFQLRC